MKKVNEITIFDKKYILKFIDIPLSYFEILSQHNYLKELRKNGILTPKFYFDKILSLFKIELQEYIYKTSETYNLKKIIKEIAIFHNISSNYKKSFYKKKYYSFKFNCLNVTLDNLLLGFNEKYYDFPIKNAINIKHDVIDYYNIIYREFINNYYEEDCIIHNDLTSNNIYHSNDNICIIDFDLSIRSSIYVDFIDIVLKRKYSIEDIIQLVNNKTLLDKYIQIYNSNSKKFKIEYKGCLLMIGLKLCSFNFYVLYNSNNSKNNIKVLEKLLKIILEKYYSN